MRPGDYYYVRVTQLDSGRAWSSPFWVGEGKPATGDGEAGEVSRKRGEVSHGGTRYGPPLHPPDLGELAPRRAS